MRDNNEEIETTRKAESTSTRTHKTGHPLIRPSHLKRSVAVYNRQSSMYQVDHNTGSTQHQRNQVDVAVSFGWHRSQIIVIEDDLGISASGTKHRPGFERLQNLIKTTKVGAILTTNASRLSRNMPELLRLLMMCASHDCLLIVDGRVVNPRDHSDIFLSQILGSVAEYENKIRAATMRQARLAKAHRGDIVSALSIGWIKRPDGTFDKDPEVEPVINKVI